MDSGNAMGNFHSSAPKPLDTYILGLGVAATDTSDPFWACKTKRVQKDLGISNPAQDLQMLDISEIANTLNIVTLETARQAGGAGKSGNHTGFRAFQAQRHRRDGWLVTRLHFRILTRQTYQAKGRPNFMAFQHLVRL